MFRKKPGCDKLFCGILFIQPQRYKFPYQLLNVGLNKARAGLGFLKDTAFCGYSGAEKSRQWRV